VEKILWKRGELGSRGERGRGGRVGQPEKKKNKATAQASIKPQHHERRTTRPELKQKDIIQQKKGEDMNEEGKREFEAEGAAGIRGEKFMARKLQLSKEEDLPV